MRFADLRERFGHVVGLAHGRQDGAARDAALADENGGQLKAALSRHALA